MQEKGFEASQSLSRQIAHHIAEQIISGDLVEGERIQELRIAEELNVSRGSVREALLILERSYLIEIFPRRGAVVSEMSLPQVRALASLAVGLLPRTFFTMLMGVRHWLGFDSNYDADARRLILNEMMTEGVLHNILYLVYTEAKHVRELDREQRQALGLARHELDRKSVV